jgi:GGDEF domain-containing protein
VTSLQKHITDLDNAESLQKATLTSYAAAIEAIAYYAVEVNVSVAEKHRGSLREIRKQLLDHAGPESLMDTQPALRAELRDYRDKCETHLKGLNQEFTAALLSLHEVISSISSTDSQEKRLTEELQKLDDLASVDNLQELRAGVRAAVKTIAGCVEQMRRASELTIAQFKDEIRIIQGRMERAEETAARDPATGAVNRTELEARVRRDMSHDAAVCLEIVKISNYRNLLSGHSQQLVDEAVLALYKRVRTQVGDVADIGRWREDAFVIKLICSRQDALRVSHELSLKLDGPYVCMLDGHRHTLHLRIGIGVADFRASEDGEKFLAKADLLLQSLA